MWKYASKTAKYLMHIWTRLAAILHALRSQVGAAGRGRIISALPLLMFTYLNPCFWPKLAYSQWKVEGGGGRVCTELGFSRIMGFAFILYGNSSIWVKSTCPRTDSIFHRWVMKYSVMMFCVLIDRLVLVLAQYLKAAPVNTSSPSPPTRWSSSCSSTPGRDSHTRSVQSKLCTALDTSVQWSHLFRLRRHQSLRRHHALRRHHTLRTV